MSGLSDYWASQCGNPRGIVGSMVIFIMPWEIAVISHMKIRHLIS